MKLGVEVFYCEVWSFEACNGGSFVMLLADLEACRIGDKNDLGRPEKVTSYEIQRSEYRPQQIGIQL